jgi:hypothetical protein
MSTVLTRFVLVSTLIAVGAALGAGTSSASGWHSNTGVRYSSPAGTGGSGIASVGATAANSSSSAVTCTGGSATFAVAGPTGPASGTWTSAITTTMTLTGCRYGAISVGVRCVLGLDANTYNGGVDTDYIHSGGKITTGVVGVDCTFSELGVGCFSLRGTAPGSYRNPTTLLGDLPNPVSTSTDGRYTFSAASQRLTWGRIGTCSGPTGTGTLTSSGGDIIINLTGSSPQPVLWRG